VKSELPAGFGEGLVAIPTYRDQPATPASDIDGCSPEGSALSVALVGVDRWTLVLFLSSDCDGCLEIWRALVDPGAFGEVSVVVVTKDQSFEDLAQLVGSVASEITLVHSPSAWRAYRVAGPPFFALVDGRRARVASEGVAWARAQIADHVASALADGAHP
jgi:hypothetical protein